MAIEDRRFWDHKGVDPEGLVRAAIANFEEGEVVQGGSTITQQYVKNTYTTGERDVARKLREALIATRLERELTKDEILFRYLNTVYFGDGAYGIGAAAESYFGKPVSELTLSEAALLAGAIASPGRYGPRVNAETANDRRLLVLRAMRRPGPDQPPPVPAGPPPGPLVRPVRHAARAGHRRPGPAPQRGDGLPVLRGLRPPGPGGAVRPPPALPGWPPHRDDPRPGAAGPGRGLGGRDPGRDQLAAGDVAGVGRALDRPRPGLRGGPGLGRQPGQPGPRRFVGHAAGLVLQDLRAGRRPRSRDRSGDHLRRPRLDGVPGL